MDFNAFLASRQHRFERLSELLDLAEAKGLAQLSAQQVDELYRLYRLVSSDLNLAQTRTGNPSLLEYLESLVARGYAALAVPQRARPISGWWQIIRHRFPAVLRLQRNILLLATLTFLAGISFGWIATAINPDMAVVFLPPEHLSQSPSERVAELEAIEAGGSTQVDSAGDYSVFSSFLFTHNIRVSLLGFALGLTFGIGTLVVLFYNGAMLGSIAQRYFDDGVFEFFIAWVGPHGAIELPCIIFACTAGLMLARAQWQAQAGDMWQRIGNIRSQLLTLLVGTATLLVLAGLIEGGFSQVNEPTLPYPVKITVAGALAIALAGYVFMMPVQQAKADDGQLRTL